MSSGYRKFSSRFADDAGKAKTFASFATFADGGRIFEPPPDTNKADSDTPEIQSASVKVAQVAKVEMPEAVCAVCGATDDLWTLGATAVHQECARFLPKPEPAEPSAAYQGITAEPDGTACRVEIVEIPATGLRYRKTFAFLQLKPPAGIPAERWRLCVEDGRAFLAKWGAQAEALNWSSADLFGLVEIPERPSPSFNRLSRYDATGLIWLLQGRRVTVLTADTAAIENPTTGTVTVYRRFNKPALEPGLFLGCDSPSAENGDFSMT